MEKEDLRRVRVNHAALVVVIADTETNYIDREDFDNIIRAINIHQAAPEVRMMLMVMRPANKMRAIAVGMPTKSVYSLNELKCNLLALSCLCPGFTTMLVNLSRSDSQLDSIRMHPAALAMLEPWRKMYLKCTAANIIGILLADEFEGLTFAEAALLAYQKSGIILLAAQNEGQIMVFPAEYIIKHSDFTFAISNDDRHVNLIALLDENGEGVDFRPTFIQNEQQMPESKMIANMKQFSRLNNRTPEPDPTKQDKKKASSNANLFKFNVVQPQKQAASAPQVQSSSPNRAQPPVLIESDQKVHGQLADEYASKGGHFVLLCLNPEQTWQQILAFCRNLRAAYQPVHYPIVVLLQTFPPPMLLVFTEVAFMVGNPVEPLDLMRVGLDRSARIALLCGPPKSNCLRKAEADTLISISESEDILRLSCSTKFAVYELLHYKTAQILPIVPEAWSDEFGATFYQDLSDELKAYIDITESTEFILSPRFAASRVFIPNLFGHLFARDSFSTPGVLELTECLSMPSVRSQTAFPFVVPIPRTLVGRTYAELVEAALTNGLDICKTETNEVCVPMGLSRNILDTFDCDNGLSDGAHVASGPKSRQLRACMTEIWDETMTTKGNDGVRFVMTNPDKSEILLPRDHIYVYASATWGMRAHQQMTTPTKVNQMIMDGTGKSEEDVDELIQLLFRTYDENRSNTIDTRDEFINLTTGIARELGPCFKDEGSLSAILDKRHFDDDSVWDLQQYIKWMKLQVSDRCKEMAADPKSFVKAPIKPANEPLQATTGGDKTRVLFTKCSSEAKMDAIISECFERYDLDESGTIDSSVEAQQLVMNLIYKFGLEVGISEAAMLSDSIDVGTGCWDLARVSKWVKEEWVTIVPKLLNENP